MKNIWIALVVFFASCGNSVVEKPSNLIPEDQMVDILYDLSLLDAMKSQSPEKLRNATDADTYIYKKYKIDSLQFAASNRYYASDMKNYRGLYQKVSDRINAELSKLEGLGQNKGRKEKLPEGGTIK
ncbi:DUF4296 domain-containing protein [Flavobacterium silvaticum]|uniref:DUF4296 domain-containing protein n=1 Tax=Flavobacterium silvaticum TaxID=1852020 RepID=A0A972G164_9FLAO|nr:DUF4296 domain-containing protein [Flavobacterium silvaticum]NMH28551.1 DUF4296 domain-containing protein [Flavobacterium silvaticum]